MSEHTPLTDEIVNALADGAVLSGQKHGAFVDVAAFTTKRVPLGDHASVIVHMARDLAESRRLLRVGHQGCGCGTCEEIETYLADCERARDEA